MGFIPGTGCLWCLWTKQRGTWLVPVFCEIRDLRKSNASVYLHVFLHTSQGVTPAHSSAGKADLSVELLQTSPENTPEKLMLVCDLQSQIKRAITEPYQCIQGLLWLLWVLALLSVPLGHNHPWLLCDHLSLGSRGRKQKIIVFVPSQGKDMTNTSHWCRTLECGIWSSLHHQNKSCYKRLPGKPRSPFSPICPGGPKIIKTSKQSIISQSNKQTL